MEELRDLHNMAESAASRFQAYDGKDFILPSRFKEQVREINSNLVYYNTYSAKIENKTNQCIYMPNQWFYIASFFTDFYRELQKYRKLAVSLIDKERLKTLNGNTLSVNEIDAINSLSLSDQSKTYLMRFITDYAWWGGAKTVDRNDFYVSPLLGCARLVNASQSFVAELCSFIAEKEDLFKDMILAQEVIGKQISQDSSRQIIFYGAPGTGKSNKIEEATNDDNRIRTTFHPDSDYSTFVGAYKPTMQNEDKYLERLCDIDYLASLFKNDYYKADKKTVAVDTFAIKYAEYLDGKYGKVSLKELCEKAEIPTGYEVAIRDTVNAYHACVKPQIKPNQIAYTFVPQAFLKAYVEAWKRMDNGNENPYYLVIEEINRGNCAQIFGDLFQLLDRNDEGESRYAIAPDDDIKRHLEKELANCPHIPEKIMKGEEMRLPSNLYIWATMNTSDQSLFPIDSAFKRRWDWEYMPIENGNKGFVIDIAGTQYDWWDFISTINAKIDRITGSEDKKLGYWFAKPAAGKTSIDCQLFVSKVLFYLWNDVYKDYADSKDSIFRADNNGQSIKTPFTTFFGSGREDRVKAFMAFNGIQPVVIKEG